MFLGSHPDESEYKVLIRPVTVSSTNTARRRRDVGSEEFKTTAAVYSPKVWDEESESWVYSDALEVFYYLT